MRELSGRGVALRSLDGVLQVSLERVDLSEEVLGASRGGVLSIVNRRTQPIFDLAAKGVLLLGAHYSTLDLGGSLVTEEALFARLRESCRVVWLRASPKEHLRRVREQGDLRPMRGRADALGELRDILAAREPLYGLAEATLDTEVLGVEGTVEALLA